MEIRLNRNERISVREKQCVLCPVLVVCCRFNVFRVFCSSNYSTNLENGNDVVQIASKGKISNCKI